MARTNTEKWLSHLISLVRPPQVPVETGSSLARKKIEKSLGTELPDDLIEFASVYGSGEFGTDEYSLVLGIYNPFSHSFAKSLQKSGKSHKAFWPGYEMYPTTPGLFICGSGNGPRDLFYLTEGSPNRWPLMSCVSLDPLTRIELSLTEYVFRLLDGSLEGKVGDIENPWFKEQKGKFRFQPYQEVNAACKRSH